MPRSAITRSPFETEAEGWNFLFLRFSPFPTSMKRFQGDSPEPQSSKKNTGTRTSTQNSDGTAFLEIATATFRLLETTTTWRSVEAEGVAELVFTRRAALARESHGSLVEPVPGLRTVVLLVIRE